MASISHGVLRVSKSFVLMLRVLSHPVDFVLIGLIPTFRRYSLCFSSSRYQSRLTCCLKAVLYFLRFAVDPVMCRLQRQIHKDRDRVRNPSYLFVFVMYIIIRLLLHSHYGTVAATPNGSDES